MSFLSGRAQRSSATIDAMFRISSSAVQELADRKKKPIYVRVSLHIAINMLMQVSE